ncbi:hypothetical protein E6R60_25745 [Streptomyces sp. A0642]|uniref:hypothetical protein n=1 Tax=Streptomyces sp. A0642 TaxID=2563100 RepID=UPI0010A212C1|nr:hypothetical protein [Streptomyces sp. A0642]THA73062.1 hypothetical protein E6R60_25745 [Streptomyces sp. A0642]
MTSVNDLVRAWPRSAALESAEPDPLREVDALQESQLLDSRVCQLTSTAALLFELRTSLQFEVGNAALLVVRGLHSFGWSSPAVRGPLTALTVVSSVPDRLRNSFRARFAFFPDAQLEVVGDLAEFHVLAVEGMGDVPPDYSDADLEHVQEALPSWSSACSPLQASRSH